MAVTTPTTALTTGTLATTTTAPSSPTAVSKIAEEAQTWLPGWLRDVTEFSILDISIWQLLVAFVIIVAALIARKIVVSLIAAYGKRGKAAEKPRLYVLLIGSAANPVGAVVLLLGALGAVQVFSFPQDLSIFLTNLCISGMYVAGAWFLFNATNVLARHVLGIAKKTDTRLDEQLVPILRTSIKVFVVIIVTLQVVDQMGGDVKGLIAGLGLGGLAFALAARDSLANIFGSVVILADQPFKVGDWIEAEGVEGVVEEIGFRSTRVRTFAKSLYTVPNSKLADWAINNWSAMPRRRIMSTIGVSYEATPEQLEAAVEGIRKIIEENGDLHTDFYLVNFNDFGDSALELFVYCFTKTTDWAQYMGIRQAFNLAIMRLLRDLGLEVAFPTRTVYLRQDQAPELPERFRGGTAD
jgi:MscS family membrane protein